MIPLNFSAFGDQIDTKTIELKQATNNCSQLKHTFFFKKQEINFFNLENDYKKSKIHSNVKGIY